MSSKKKARIYFIVLFTASILTLFSPGKERDYLCNFNLDICYTDYNSIIGAIFLLFLFTSSIFFVRLISTDTGFASWKKLMKYFVSIVLFIALIGGFSSGGGSWAVGSPDGEIMMWLLGIVYVVGSLITIIRHRKH
ncbi:MAG: hypothetical protein KAS07_03165 [Candidatus Pacebacteria bacterium]|nr:hypothetical protein [Candidatus Paceibacterota bacterium]